MKHFVSIGFGSLYRAAGMMIFLLVLCVMIAPAKGAESKKLSFAVLPILDAVPVHYALENGYFAHEGITVEAVFVGSALERDQLMQAGRIDGMIGENAVVAGFNREKVKLKVTGIARESVEGFPLFRILSSPKSNIKKIGDLSNIPIAVSKNTIIEYVTDRILVKSGLNKTDVVTKSVPVIPERFQLLIHDRIKAAVIPDPLALSAVKSGAGEIINDTKYPEVSASVVIFSSNALTKKKESVKSFMKAWDKAAEMINADPSSAVGIVKKRIRVPKNVTPDYIIPPFPRRKVPSKFQWDDTIDWMMEKKLISEPVSYDISVTKEYLP